MRSRASTASFVLFVIVVLGTVFWLMDQHGKTNWGLVAVLVGVLLLRAGLFAMNLRQQRRNIERGRGPVKIETRLGLTDEPENPSDEASPAEASPETTARPDTPAPPRP